MDFVAALIRNLIKEVKGNKMGAEVQGNIQIITQKSQIFNIIFMDKYSKIQSSRKRAELSSRMLPRLHQSQHLSGG